MEGIETLNNIEHEGSSDAVWKSDEDSDNSVKQIGSLYPGSMAYRVYSVDGICPSLRTPTGGGCIPLIKVKYEDSI